MPQTDNRFTTEALVVKEMKIGESDRLVTLFSREYGIIKAFASGAKNILFLVDNRPISTLFIFIAILIVAHLSFIF